MPFDFREQDDIELARRLQDEAKISRNSYQCSSSEQVEINKYKFEIIFFLNRKFMTQFLKRPHTKIQVAMNN